MPYPGGAALDKLAYEGDPKAIKFPSPALHGDNLDFSFSGLKTSALNYINSNAQKGIGISYADVAASYTDCVVKAITQKVEAALEKSGATSFALSGGVAANSHLRSSLLRLCERKGISIAMPDRSLCGDNGAMIALAGYYEYKKGNFADTYLNASAYSPLD
jgi:N6-L-threonylcarbamoyladenine synthase